LPLPLNPVDILKVKIVRQVECYKYLKRHLNNSTTKKLSFFLKKLSLYKINQYSHSKVKKNSNYFFYRKPFVQSPLAPFFQNTSGIFFYWRLHHFPTHAYYSLTHTRSHPHPHPHTPNHTRTHTPTPAHTHTHTHTHTITHTLSLSCSNKFTNLLSHSFSFSCFPYGVRVPLFFVKARTSIIFSVKKLFKDQLFSSTKKWLI